MDGLKRSGLAGETMSLEAGFEGFTLHPVSSLLPVCVQDVSPQIATPPTMPVDSYPSGMVIPNKSFLDHGV